MPSTNSFGTKEPISFWNKPLKVDLPKLFKEVAGCLITAVAQKWDEAAKHAVEVGYAFAIDADPGERASILIGRALTKAVFDLVKEAAPHRLAEACNAQEDQSFQQLLLRPAIIDSSFFDDPKNLPLVAQFAESLEHWLRSQGLTNSTSKSVANRFPSYFVFALMHEWRLNPKYYEPIKGALENTPFSKASEQEMGWMEYNSYLARSVEENVYDEPLSLSQLYVPLNAYTLTSKDSDDGDLAEVDDLETIINDWLIQPSSRGSIRVISGGPGSGKSSFARMYAAKHSNQGSMRILYVKLHLIDPNNDLVEEVGKFTKGEGFLVNNPIAHENPESNLLLIFDGLDELTNRGNAASEVARNFIIEVEKTLELRSKNHNVRAIISGREIVVQGAETAIRGQKKIITVLPYLIDTNRRNPIGEKCAIQDAKNLLRVDLRQAWWKNYGLLKGEKYDGLPVELDRNDLKEITAQPLLNYLLALAYSRKDINFSGHVNVNDIYSDMIDGVYDRGYEMSRAYGPLTSISRERFKRVLQEVAVAAWHGSSRSATVKEIYNQCAICGILEWLTAFQEGAKAGVTSLLAAFFFKRHGKRDVGEDTFVFTHKSFGEYLVACKIVRLSSQLAEERQANTEEPDKGWSVQIAHKKWFETCGASPVTDATLRFIQNEIERLPMEKARNIQASLAELFSYVIIGRYSVQELNAGTSLNEIQLRCRNTDECILAVMCTAARITKIVSPIKHPDPSAFSNWLDRSLLGLDYSRVISDNLAFLNLSNLVIAGKTFFCVSFEGSDLSGSSINLSMLYNVNFGGANLRGTHFWQNSVNFGLFMEADLSFCGLNSCVFNNCDWRRANIDNIEIDNTHFDQESKSLAEIKAAQEAQMLDAIPFQKAVKTTEGGFRVTLPTRLP